MTKYRSRVAASVLFAAMAACAPAARSAPDATRPAPAGSMSELESLYWARQDSARLRFSEADVEFMSGMIGHHAQALVMSALAPERAQNPMIQTLAARIINAQQDEITMMQDWLRMRGQAVPEVHIEGTKLMIHGGSHHHHHDDMQMPGMLSQAQLDELAGARGAEFDRLFLTYMIQHHRGAITMVAELLGKDGAAQDPAVFKLASDIQVDQLTEIARMERMLSAMAPSRTSQ